MNRVFLLTFKIMSFIGLMTFSNTSLALIDFEEAVYPELITSGRAQAMGNAFIAKVDDSASSFYNPSGLGTVRRKGSHFHISNFHLESNKDWLTLTTGGKVTDAFSNFSKGFNLEGTRQLLRENKGKISHSRFQLMPNITMRYFSAGYMFSKRTRATIGTETDALFEYADRTDHGPYASLNLSIFGGIFKIGATAILLNRKELIDEQAQDQVFNTSDGDYAKGSAAMIIAGTKLTLPWEFLPTFAATIHNAAAQEFSKTGATNPDPIKQTVDLGFSITPQIGNIVRIHLEANYKDAAQAHSGVSLARKLTFGAELDIGRTFFFRAGWGDGFGSGGLGLRTKKLEFDLTTYAVDTTSNSYRGKEDRRFSLSVSSGF